MGEDDYRGDPQISNSGRHLEMHLSRQAQR